jgi:hypothetical protein
VRREPSKAPFAPNLGNNDLSATFTPVSFSFSDGVQTFTNDTPGVVSTFAVNTDYEGDIVNWAITVESSDSSAGISTTYFDGNISEYSGIFGYGGGQGSAPGAWSISSETVRPEPGSLVLLATGCVVFEPVRRRLRA